MKELKTTHQKKIFNNDLQVNNSMAFSDGDNTRKYLGAEGEKIGHITITKFIGFTGDGKPRYMYKCDCGNIGTCNVQDAYRSESNGAKPSCGSCPRNLYELIFENTVVGYDSNNGIFLLDLKDYNELNIFDYNWSIREDKDNRAYVKSSGHNHRKQIKEYKSINLHSYVLGLHFTTSKLVGDHIHNNKCWDNRQKNLRVVTQQQNTFNTRNFSTNTTGTKGVYRWKDEKSEYNYYARIRVNGEHIHLGMFVEKEDAIEARKIAEEKYFGEYNYNEEFIKEDTIQDDVLQMLLNRKFINDDGTQNKNIIKDFLDTQNFKPMKLNKVEITD